jgi:sialate O-acetylesterase
VVPWIFALAASAPSSAAAQAPTFAGIFGEHAVLQRDRPLAIWGRAEAAANVTVKLHDRIAQATADVRGIWRVQLPALPAGGPYVLSVSANGSTTALQDIMIGDVFLCGGQSNMELTVANATNAPMEVAFSANSQIRFANVPRDSSLVRREEFKAAPQWQVAGPQATGQASAACYYMARALHRRYEVPVGFVNASWGGSTIQSWISDASLRKLDGYGQALDVVQQYAADAAAGMHAEERRQEAWWERVDPHARAQRAWARPEFDDSAWAGIEPGERWSKSGVASLGKHRGVVWFRATVELTAQQAGEAAQLQLGQVAAADTTWVNGVRVGAGSIWWNGREYAVPKGVLKPGKNVIAVRVLGDESGGGLLGPAGQRALLTANGGRIALPPRWKYRVGSQLSAAQPGAPWEPPSSLTTLYNGMIAPLQGFGFKLVAWYQGEANAGAAQEYRRLLPLLFSDWRQAFAQPDLPFLVAQLSSFGSVASKPGYSAWAELRQAQSEVVRSDPHAGLAVTFDFGDRSDIHPGQKAIVGERLARAARAVAYGEKITPGGPEAVSATRSGNDIVIRFANTNGGLRTYSSDTAIGFEVCERDVCKYAHATVDGDTLRLRGAATRQASKVRYAWADAPFINLYSADDLPANGFELPVSEDAQAGGGVAPCAPDALGTSRVLTLKRAHARYGTVHYGALPLQGNEVVLTFDDGPAPETMERVLKTLAAHCVKATFFMTGANLARHPELGRRVVQDGHTPALHSFAHPRLREMPADEQLADLEKGIETFAAVFGAPPAAYRFPFLDETPAIMAALEARRIAVASMDLGIDDYMPNDMRSAALVARLEERLKRSGGGIVLMHDANRPTAEALPALLKAIRDNGYRVVHLRWEGASAHDL